MNPSALHPTPRWPGIIREQLRAVGVATRREMALAGLLLALLTPLFVLDYFFDDGQPFSFDLSDMTIPMALLGAFAPMAVWKGEEPSRRSYFWAMPVDRARHTLVKVFGGWAWLMALVAVFLLWIVSIALSTGGNIGVQEVQVFLAGLPAGALPDDDAATRRWTAVPAWMWLVPFTGATAAYLVGSVVVLASDHPWRWLAGLAFGVMLLFGMADALDVEPALGAFLQGPYGVETASTGISVQEAVITVDGDHARVRRHRPVAGHWATATLLWTGLGLAGVLAAAFRHQER